MEKHWIEVSHFIPKSDGEKFCVMVDGMPTTATLRRNWWSDRWYREGIRIYPTHWTYL
jgi:hypothetical protein